MRTQKGHIFSKKTCKYHIGNLNYFYNKQSLLINSPLFLIISLILPSKPLSIEIFNLANACADEMLNNKKLFNNKEYKNCRCNRRKNSCGNFWKLL